MNLSALNPDVIAVLKKSGWHEKRDVSHSLEFTEEKFISDEFLEIAASFAYLEIKYTDKYNRDCVIYFDLDESIESKNVLARTYGYESHEDPEWLKSLEYTDSEDFDLTNKITNKIGQNCSRFAFWDDRITTFDLYVCEKGEIYGGNDDDPILISDNFTDFLNETIAIKHLK